MGIDVVMCDEAHFLKNGEAQITQAVAGLTTAKRRLLMSGERPAALLHAAAACTRPALHTPAARMNQVGTQLVMVGDAAGC